MATRLIIYKVIHNYKIVIWYSGPVKDGNSISCIYLNLSFCRGTQLNHYEIMKTPSGFKINVDNRVINRTFLGILGSSIRDYLQIRKMFGFQLKKIRTSTTMKLRTPWNNHWVYGCTDYFPSQNPNIQLPETHPPTKIRTLFGFVNPYRILDNHVNRIQFRLLYL